MKNSIERINPGNGKKLAKKIENFLGNNGINREVVFNGKGMGGMYYFTVKTATESSIDDITFASESLTWEEIYSEAKKQLIKWGIDTNKK